jgi:hypothetical protein
VEQTSLKFSVNDDIKLFPKLVNRFQGFSNADDDSYTAFGSNGVVFVDENIPPTTFSVTVVIFNE